MPQKARASSRRQYEEIQKVLEEDQRVTLTQMEMEERAAVLALDDLEETSCALSQEIEVDLSRISSELARTEEGGEEERREEEGGGEGQTDSMVTRPF